jgi:hypothetical protein
MVCQQMRDSLGAGESRCLDDAVCSVCSSQCMLYSVNAVHGVCCHGQGQEWVILVTEM